MSKIETVEITHPKFDGTVTVNKGSEMHLEGKEFTEEVLESSELTGFDFSEVSFPMLRKHAEKAGIEGFSTMPVAVLRKALTESGFQPE